MHTRDCNLGFVGCTRDLLAAEMQNVRVTDEDDD